MWPRPNEPFARLGSRVMARRRTLRVAAAGVALSVGVLAGWFYFSASSDGKADPANTERVRHGMQLYAIHCASCHGVALEGQPDWRSRKPDGKLPAPPHDASGHTWHHPDAVLFGITRDGLARYAPAGYSSDMPAFHKTLSDDDIWAILAFIKSTWPAEIQQRQRAING